MTLVATRRQLNALAAGLVSMDIAPIDRAGDLAVEMLEACGYDMSKFQTETVDRRKPFLYASSSDEREN